MKKTLGLDESGNDHLGKVDPDYPVFVVGGVILEDDYIPTASEAVNAFKRDLFGRDDFVLHTAEFTRGRGAFTRVQEPSFREQFYEQLYRMMRALEFSVIACVFDLNRYASHPQTAAPNLYSLALPRLTSQFCDIIGNRYHGGRIRVEKGVASRIALLRGAGTNSAILELLRPAHKRSETALNFSGHTPRRRGSSSSNSPISSSRRSADISLVTLMSWNGTSCARSSTAARTQR